MHGIAALSATNFLIPPSKMAVAFDERSQSEF
jgi:hypothetical protein